MFFVPIHGRSLCTTLYDSVNNVEFAEQRRDRVFRNRFLDRSEGAIVEYSVVWRLSTRGLSENASVVIRYYWQPSASEQMER